MSGINLRELDSSEFLDVVHYYFEEDSKFSTREEAIAKTETRKRFYKMFYDMEYVYGLSEKDAASIEDSGEIDGVKPYVPPTDFNPESINPFGSVLDSPIN